MLVRTRSMEIGSELSPPSPDAFQYPKASRSAMARGQELYQHSPSPRSPRFTGFCTEVPIKHPNYTEILTMNGFIVPKEKPRGRKASKDAYEEPIPAEEFASTTHGHMAAWWVKLGEFKSCTERDDYNWNPLYHALDSMTFCSRAVVVSHALIPLLNTEDVNIKTTGERPNGFTALHFACDGANHHEQRNCLVKMLLNKKADIDATDASGNTPLILAAGHGALVVCETLVESKCNIHAKNRGNKGAYDVSTNARHEALSKYLENKGATIATRVQVQRWGGNYQYWDDESTSTKRFGSSRAWGNTGTGSSQGRGQVQGQGTGTWQAQGTSTWPPSSSSHRPCGERWQKEW